MRFIFLVLLILIVIILAAFALVNREATDVDFPFTDTQVRAPLFVVMLAVYGFGMLSGWTVIGFFRSAIHRASDRHD